jgi:hypothetical protein
VTRARGVLAAALALALAASGAGCARDGDRSPPPSATVLAPVALLPALDARHEPLRARFDAAAGSPRLLVLASPT